MTLLQRIDATEASIFSARAITNATLAVGGLLDPIDQLLAALNSINVPNNNSLPGLSQHVISVKALAQSWAAQYRPTLVTTIQQLASAGNYFTTVGAPHLLQLFQTINLGGPDKARALQDACALIASIEQRFAPPALAVDAFTHQVGVYLSHVQAAAAQLAGDASSASQKIQQDTQQVATCKQNIADLQSKLDAAQSRAKWYWLLGPLGAIIAQEIDSLASNISGVKQQLQQISVDSANAQQDMAYLNALLPALSSYVSALDHLGAGVNGLLAGIQQLQSQLKQVQEAVGSSAFSGDFAVSQLNTAVSDWREVASNLSRFG